MLNLVDGVNEYRGSGVPEEVKRLGTADRKVNTKRRIRGASCVRTVRKDIGSCGPCRA